jgi:hypothetical protein
MKNLKRVLHTVERQVVDSSGWRSQPKSTRISLPYLRILDDSVMPASAGSVSDRRVAA